MNELGQQSKNTKRLTFIKASSCFAPLFLSRLAIFAIPTLQADHKANVWCWNQRLREWSSPSEQSVMINGKMNHTLCRWHISWFPLCRHKYISSRHHHWYLLKCTNSFMFSHFSLKTGIKVEQQVSTIINLYDTFQSQI